MKNYNILDLSRVLAGPWAVQHLADQGANVIKVEPPTGDETRHFGPFEVGTSTYFLCANRNKRSICLDLKTKAGRSVLRALVGWADVIVENFRPGVMERLGFAWPVVQDLNPRAIMVSISAFGVDDPEWAARPGYDLLIQHMGGQTSMTGNPGDPPLKHPTSIADQVAGLYAVQAILQALLHRHETGEGQHITVNMMQAQAAGLAYHASRYAATGNLASQQGNSHAGIVPYDTYRCADGWVVVACANDATFARLTEALDLPRNPNWITNAGRLKDREAVDYAITERCKIASKQMFIETLQSARVPCGPVLQPDETLSHPSVTLIEVPHPSLGPLRLPGPVIQTASTVTTHQAPPALDEHRDAILSELGFDAPTVDELVRAGAFPAHSDQT